VSTDRPPRHDASLLGTLSVLGAAFLFSTGGAAIKLTSLSPWQVASFRSGIAAITLAILVPRALRSIDRRTLLVGVAYAATMVLYVAANKYTTAANAIFLQATAPLYILILAPRLLGERSHRSDLGWMAAIGLGLAAFFVGDQRTFATAPEPWLGNLLGAGSGVTWAFTIMGLRWVGSARVPAGGSDRGKRDGGRSRPGAAAALAGNTLASLACLPWALPVALASTGWVDWLAVIHLGVFQIGVAYVLLTDGMEHVPALEASLLLLIEPTFSPLWAWIVHGEVPGPWAWAGGALILSATTGMAVAAERRKRRLRRELG
jgi:drug/metabolite transporter (DMT)-like permease